MNPIYEDAPTTSGTDAHKLREQVLAVVRRERTDWSEMDLGTWGRDQVTVVEDVLWCLREVQKEASRTDSPAVGGASSGGLG